MPESSWKWGNQFIKFSDNPHITLINDLKKKRLRGQKYFCDRRLDRICSAKSSHGTAKRWYPSSIGYLCYSENTRIHIF